MAPGTTVSSVAASEPVWGCAHALPREECSRNDSCKGPQGGPVQAPPATDSERRRRWGKPPVCSHSGREPERAGTELLASLAGEGFSPGTDPPPRAHPGPQGAASRCRSVHGCRTRLACLHPSWAEGDPAGRERTVLDSAGSLGLGWRRPRPSWKGVWASLCRLPSLAGASCGLVYGSWAGGHRSGGRASWEGAPKSWGLVGRGGGSELVDPPSWLRQMVFPSVKWEQ